MAAPVANFDLSSNFLAIQFQDLSLNVPTSWSWDFGDGSPVSTSQNPAHTYSATGTYVVSLTVTNADGSSNKTLSLLVSATAVVPLTISEIVRRRMPGNLTVDTLLVESYKKEYQLYLQPLLNPAIVDADVFNESAWPPLANLLVAELVSYRLIADEVNRLTLALTNTASNTSTQSQGALKKLVTGPSEAEWYNTTESTTQFLSSTFRQGSSFESNTVGMICTLAKRLDISLDICGQSKKFARPFIVIKRD